jgi:hypothetical protein
MVYQPRYTTRRFRRLELLRRVVSRLDRDTRQASGRLAWHIRAVRYLLSCALLAASFSGCAVVVAEEPGGPIYAPGRAASPKIPPGHLPPPGSCRIWFPDRPPGHQPPPGRCEELQYKVLPGAYLIRG